MFANSLLSSVAQILPTFGNSRSGTSGMQFLKVWPDARSGALGGAVTAIVNDPSAAYWNPAASDCNRSPLSLTAVLAVDHPAGSAAEAVAQR